MSDLTIELLKDLVAIDSVNPSLVPGGAGESAIAQRIAAELRASGLDAQVADAAPGRPNVFGVIDSGRPGPALMLCGHSDTVGVEGMAAPVRSRHTRRQAVRPRRAGHEGRRGRDPRRGATARAVAACGRKGRVIVAIVADEEYASIGAEAVVKDWKADAAVVAEPTDLAIGVGHKGFEWVEVETHGVAAHGSRPDDGVDAILMMGRVLGELDALERRFIAGPRHPLLGRPSLHASLIGGGRELSTYPDRCTLSVERRTVTGERPQSLLREVETILARLRDGDPRLPRGGATPVRPLALPDAGGTPPAGPAQ